MYLNNKVTNVFLNIINGLVIILILSPAAYSREVIGWVENVGVSPLNVIVKAKIDTGANSSSLHCDCINKFIRDGESWVSFMLTDVDGKQVTVEKKLLRKVKVKRHFGDAQRRDVIRLGVCIGSHYEETDVSLVDRTGLNYSMLIGRKFLSGNFLVDPSATFASSPNCSDVE
jgi:hypothetical protein